jgi:hypothetical protein
MRNEEQPMGYIRQKKKAKAKQNKNASPLPLAPLIPAQEGVEAADGTADPAPTHGTDIPPTHAPTTLIVNAFDTGSAQPGKKAKQNKSKRDSRPMQDSTQVPESSQLGQAQVLPGEHQQHPKPAGGPSDGTVLPSAAGKPVKMDVIRVSKKTRSKGGASKLQKIFAYKNDGVDERQPEGKCHRPAASHKRNHHGSFRGLPESFDPWPRPPSSQLSAPSKRTALPQLVVKPPEHERTASNGNLDAESDLRGP